MSGTARCSTVFPICDVNRSRVCHDGCFRYDIHTLHTSWQLPNIMAMPNFNIYLGAYASWLDSTAAKSGNPDERYGARVRFKYFF